MLVVDDEPDTLDIAAHVQRERGAQGTTVANPAGLSFEASRPEGDC